MSVSTCRTKTKGSDAAVDTVKKGFSGIWEIRWISISKEFVCCASYRFDFTQSRIERIVEVNGQFSASFIGVHLTRIGEVKKDTVTRADMLGIGTLAPLVRRSIIPRYVKVKHMRVLNSTKRRGSGKGKEVKSKFTTKVLVYGYL